MRPPPHHVLVDPSPPRPGHDFRLPIPLLGFHRIGLLRFLPVKIALLFVPGYDIQVVEIGVLVHLAIGGSETEGVAPRGCPMPRSQGRRERAPTLAMCSKAFLASWLARSVAEGSVDGCQTPELALCPTRWRNGEPQKPFALAPHHSLPYL